MVHGRQQTIASTRAIAVRVNHLPGFAAGEPASTLRTRYAAQAKRKGSSEASEGFVISVKPQRSPYLHQSRERRACGSSSVAQRSAAASRAERDVSQIHSKGIITAAGKMAQRNAPSRPAVELATRLPAKNKGKQAAAEKIALRQTRQKKDAAVKMPNTLNVPATIRG